MVRNRAMMPSVMSALTFTAVSKPAYQCLSLHGGWGYMKEFAISQWFTDVRLYNIGAGTTEVMKEIIAKELQL